MRNPPQGASFVPRRILVREVNWLGDAVMSTPALQRLRERHPQAYIALLCPAKMADLWRHFPGVDEVLTFAPGETPWSVGRRLRAPAFDTALVFPNSPRSALETWFARIPRRIGYAQPWRNWLLTKSMPFRSGRKPMNKKSSATVRQLIGAKQQRPEISQRYLPSTVATPHQMNEYLHLVAELGANPAPVHPLLAVEPDEIRAATCKFALEEASRGGNPVLALNPGAEYGHAKRWPVDNFIAAAREIQKRIHCAWLILGARRDMTLANTIESALLTPQTPPVGSALRAPRSAVKNLAGQTSLRELMALLKFSRVLLTNDTGPMHIAAALGTSVVVPFGSTAPELTGPGLPGDSHNYLLQADVACAPCFLRTCPIDFRCMKAITAERVVDAVLEVVAFKPR